MPVKIRLQRRGRKKAPFYHIVIADARSPRDGRFIEKIGTYNPLTVPASIELDREAAYDWLMKGAQPTDTVRAILRYKGVLYLKHLMRGVRKGAMTEEEARKLYDEFVEGKESRITEHREQTAESVRKRLAEIDGKPKAKEEPKVEAEAEAGAEDAAPADENAEAPAAEDAAEAPAAEEAKEEPAAEEPKAEEPKTEEPKTEEPKEEEPKAEAAEENTEEKTEE